MKALRKILFVEDQPDIQMIARVALESISHYQVHICSSGEEAIQQVAEFDPDLLLLDVMMPGLDGPQTLAEIRKIDRFQSLPVIFMTAKVLPSEIEALKSLGALDVIKKPFEPVELGNDIQATWDRQA